MMYVAATAAAVNRNKFDASFSNKMHCVHVVTGMEAQQEDTVLTRFKNTHHIIFSNAAPSNRF